jgi:4-hydroxy-tetrahydrodipicolinate synthase
MICELLANKEYVKAEKISVYINRIDHLIAKGHPLYGHQCYSKALAAARGYPVGDVRPPITTFASLGDEGRDRLKTLMGMINELNALLPTL